MRQGVAYPMHPPPLPSGFEDPRDGGLEAGIRVADHQPYTAEEQRAKVGDARRGGISWRSLDAVQFSAEKGICHMHEDTITRLPDPSGFAPDALTEVIRSGARKLIEQAIEAELLAAFSAERLVDGRARLVRHGTLPEREVQTVIGPVAVKVPRLHDRGSAVFGTTKRISG